MSDITGASAAITVDLKKYRIRIHKTVIHLLQDPAFLLLLVNPEDRSICVSCGDPNDIRSHRVRLAALKGGNSFELCSKSLCTALMDVCPEWDESHSYRCNGELVAGMGTVRFPLTDAHKLCAGK